jgi:hypothetical protein
MVIPPVQGPAAEAEHEEAVDADEENASDEWSISEVTDEAPLAGVEPAVSAALINKLREKAYENRQRLVEKRNMDERLLFPFTWSHMSMESQSKVMEDPDFERMYAELDSVKLWNTIRRSHLTHIFGDDDEMSYVNIHDQSVKYSYLRQGEKQSITSFKKEFDEHVKACEGVGIPDIAPQLRAMDFIGKLDPKRFSSMLTFMRNAASHDMPGAYPKNVAAAFRTASTWVREGSTVPIASHTHTAFLAESESLTKTKDS